VKKSVFWLGAVKEEEWVDEKREVVQQRYVDSSIGSDDFRGYPKEIAEVDVYR